MRSFAPHFLIVAILLFGNTALASPYRTAPAFDHSALKRAAAGKLGVGKHAISPVRLHALVPGIGALHAVFSQRREFTPNQDVVLLRGFYRVGANAAQPISAALFGRPGTNQNLSILFSHSRRDSLASTRLVELEVKSPLAGGAKRARIKSPSALVLKSLACGADSAGIAQVAAPLSLGGKYQTSAATFRVLEISTEADAFWSASFGSSASSQILATLNAAELIYEQQLSITFSVVTQDLNSLGVTSSTDPNTLLVDFATKASESSILGNADAYHLFTSRDLDDSVTGLAYVGAVCSDYAYGLTAHVSTALDYIILAHELGHNFGALHAPESNSVMYAYVDVTHTQFSSTSLSQINSYLSTNSACLSSITVTNTPTPSPTPGGSSTPVPGATPTPTADGSPTPTGGGGSGGGSGGNDPGSDPQLPTLELSTSLNNSGDFSGTLTLNGGLLRSACTSILQISKDTSFSKASTVQLADGLTTSVTFSASVPYKVKTPQTTKKPDLKVYLRAAYSCTDAGQPGLSAKLKLNARRVKGKAISKASYIKKLVASVVSGSG